MTAWPTSLPQNVQVRGYGERLANTALRSSMEAGAPKVRRRFTAAPKQVEVSLVMTSAETEDLEEFYDDALYGGTQPFDWTLPRTGAAITYRFLEPPSFRAAGPDQWEVAMKLETVP